MQSSGKSRVIAIVINLFKNPALGKRLGVAARKLVEEKYSWDRIIRGIGNSK